MHWEINFTILVAFVETQVRSEQYRIIPLLTVIIHHKMRIRDRSTVYAFSLSVCMGSFVFGYELTSFGNVKSLIMNYNQIVDESQANRLMSLLTSSLALAAIAGIVLYRILIRNFGWIYTFQLTDYLTIISAAIGMWNLSGGAQTTSRVLFGLATGINTILIPTYLTSVIPGSMGGPAGTFNQLFITIGIFMGFFMGFLVLGDITQGNSLYWRLIIGLPIIPALIRLHTTQNVFPYEYLQTYIESRDYSPLQHYLNLIYDGVTIQEFIEAKRLPQIDIQAEKAGFFDPVGESHRRRLLLSFAVVFLNHMSGGAALGSFCGTEAFQTWAGEDQREILTVYVYLNLLQIIVTLISGQLLQKYGRRAFMLEGQRIIIIALLLTAFVEIFVPELHFFTVIFTFVQMVGFSVCYGPCTFLIGTEVLHDIFYPALLLWSFIFVHMITIAGVIEMLGIGPLCLLYGVLQIGGYLYVQSYQIETQGRLRRDIYDDFRKGSFPNPLIYSYSSTSNRVKFAQMID